MAADRDDVKSQISHKAAQYGCNIRRAVIAFILISAAYSIYRILFMDDYDDPRLHDPAHFDMNGAVLLSFIASYAEDKYSNRCPSIRFSTFKGPFHVPNIVHYVWFSNEATPHKMSFIEYMSFRSVATFQCPSLIMIHGNAVPSGEWWRKTLTEIPNIYHIYRERPSSVNGINFAVVEHASDLVRIDVLRGKCKAFNTIIIVKLINDCSHQFWSPYVDATYAAFFSDVNTLQAFKNLHQCLHKF